MEKADAVFYALLKMGNQCPQAITPHPNPLSKKIESTWLVEVEHAHNDLGKHGDYTFWYKIVDDPKRAEWGCRQGFNDLTLAGRNDASTIEIKRAKKNQAPELMDPVSVSSASK